MKILLIIFIVFISNLGVHAQTIKLRTTSVSSKYHDGNNWSNWSEWQKFETLGIINGDSKNITLYSEPKEVYDIISKKDPQKELGIIAAFNCVDMKGEECVIEIRDGGKNKSLQLYIIYDNGIMAINFNKA